MSNQLTVVLRIRHYVKNDVVPDSQITLGPRLARSAE